MSERNLFANASITARKGDKATGQRAFPWDYNSNEAFSQHFPLTTVVGICCSAKAFYTRKSIAARPWQLTQFAGTPQQYHASVSSSQIWELAPIER